ncbi:hypothetical protein GFC29_1088 [Anoxybacillus sp. B7M1]|uniref:Uncharacterized protein n=2 Tax=Anoxybacillaceae TaxID=3120669 RepID=A0ABD5IU14_9BACL|nr:MULTISPECIES: hypothetical protein [Anoxybacillus]ANB58383.1 hypothetical protein GFC28_536 [Anoxybacillus sp. B2M1]ANB62897.1 hypothetical protein GFC29_1088 [Anoxybacillus sp. B7M1]MBB3907946.1 hypothetical protein [Anoxybacillus rupiensis]MED5051698.1 hypothetical protein [Anoxybacillus rupiensis]QHC04285.1 hypothetical protein GRQ40_10155 [Anoxybacillus sp. PDR2]
MSSEKLVTLLNEMWASIVESFHIDILYHTISLKVKVSDTKGHYQIIFKGVSSFYFIENSGEFRLNPIDPEDGDYTELTSIDYYQNGIGKIHISSAKEIWVGEYFSSANFVLEFWEALLFIEAKSIVINEEEFLVDYPLKEQS